jgi:hypothetical protein
MYLIFMEGRVVRMKKPEIPMRRRGALVGRRSRTLDSIEVNPRFSSNFCLAPASQLIWIPRSKSLILDPETNRLLN